MRIEFADSEYRRAHWAAPRGRGYWGFSFEGREFWTTGTLTEAKRACREEIRKVSPAGYAGVVWVNILP